MRREDRKITESEAIAILQNGEFGVLSMSTSNAEGYGIPLNFAFKNHVIYFHCALEGSKLEHLRINNRASFCVVGRTNVLPAQFGTKYESAIAYGIVTEIEGDEKLEALMLILEKYSANYIQEGAAYLKNAFDSVKVLKLSIKELTGKARK
jgi:nitroimidazol reductase NimA-like FMN-containing flavoprotein (pyridoxamine 5'-phosphate oxidase superfamily)